MKNKQQHLKLPSIMNKILFAATLSLLLFACGKKDEPAGNDLASLKAKRAELQTEITKIDEAIAKLDTVKELALVSVVTVKDTVFTHFIDIQGNVTTKEDIIIQPEVSGTLVMLNAKAGQKVTKGQVLARVDDGGMSQQVAQLQTQLALARTTYERQKNLWDQKIGSEIQFLQAKTNMQALQKQVNQMRAQVAKTVIRAPFTGTIDQVSVERGQVVAPSQLGLMRIVRLTDMYVETTVPETYIGKVTTGTDVQVELPSLSKTYTGKIRQVGNYINPDNRSFGIEVAVPNPDNLLRPNQVAKLKIIDYVNQSAVIVPSNVVLEDATGQKFVYIAENVQGKTATAKKIIVKPGQSANNMTEIVEGLSAGDIVVTEGANTLSNGMKLNF
jgi:membrane fusion protein (multidrug efflux system)